MKVPLSLMTDLEAAMDLIMRDTTPAWLNAAASVLEICARDIRSLTAAQVVGTERILASSILQTFNPQQP